MRRLTLHLFSGVPRRKLLMPFLLGLLSVSAVTRNAWTRSPAGLTPNAW